MSRCTRNAAPGVGMRTGTKVGAFPRGLEAQAGSVSTPRRFSAERAPYSVLTDSPWACAYAFSVWPGPDR